MVSVVLALHSCIGHRAVLVHVTPLLHPLVAFSLGWLRIVLCRVALRKGQCWM